MTIAHTTTNPRFLEHTAAAHESAIDHLLAAASTREPFSMEALAFNRLAVFLERKLIVDLERAHRLNYLRETGFSKLQHPSSHDQ